MNIEHFQLNADTFSERTQSLSQIKVKTIVTLFAWYISSFLYLLARPVVVAPLLLLSLLFLLITIFRSKISRYGILTVDENSGIKISKYSEKLLTWYL